MVDDASSAIRTPDLLLPAKRQATACRFFREPDEAGSIRVRSCAIRWLAWGEFERRAIRTDQPIHVIYGSRSDLVSTGTVDDIARMTGSTIPSTAIAPRGPRRRCRLVSNAARRTIVTLEGLTLRRPGEL
jgi:hypothetical protein